MCQNKFSMGSWKQLLALSCSVVVSHPLAAFPSKDLVMLDAGEKMSVVFILIICIVLCHGWNKTCKLFRRVQELCDATLLGVTYCCGWLSNIDTLVVFVLNDYPTKIAWKNILSICHSILLKFLLVPLKGESMILCEPTRFSFVNRQFNQ